MDERGLILCVEDNDANYALMRRVLESTGRWDVTRATRAEQAREALERRPPAVILLDIDLPGMDGLTLARELKASERWRSIPIVVVSASVMKQERAKAEAAGCEFFVEKPFDIDELRDVVRAAVES